MNIQTAKLQANVMSKAIPAIAGLDSLKKAKDIAAFLKRRGIKGKLEDACNCPVARFIKKAGVKRVDVNYGEIEFPLGKFEPKLSIDMPGAIEKFIQEFDGGNFPEITEGGKAACDKIKKKKAAVAAKLVTL